MVKIMECTAWKLLIFLSLFKYAIPSENHVKEKRILVNDPQVLSQKVLDLMAKVQEINVELSKHSQELKEQQRKNLNLEQALASQNQTVKLQQQALNHVTNTLSFTKSATGSVYVRWGHHSCPHNTTKLIYSGFAGGSWYNNPGSAVDYLCLPPDPQWNQYNDAYNVYGGQLFGAEYENIFFHKDQSNRDVPCAVCQSDNPTYIMIPARTNCYHGWIREYSGYLASGNQGSVAASSYVCVDDTVETMLHSQQDQDGKLFLMVESRCGAVSCPPYVDGREVTCVVCSQLKEYTNNT